MTSNAIQQHDAQSLIGSIIDYWFADIGEGFDLKQQHKRWYFGGREVDDDIERRFKSWVDKALSGHLNNWADTAEGVLALVLLLDQFPRHIYRGSAGAFAGDDLALQWVHQALLKGHDRQLTAVQRSFFYMPLEHAESLLEQDRCIELFEQLLAEVPEQGKVAIQSSLDFAIKHRHIIQRFGRFPHRNQALGRIASADEEAFLLEGGARFDQ